MGVRMGCWLVRVFMRMARHWSAGLVDMAMVAVVVAVPVDVPGRSVRMLVFVPLAVQQPQRREHHGSGRHLDRENGLEKDSPRQHDPPERGRREDHLGPRRAELLRSSDVQHQRRP